MSCNGNAAAFVHIQRHSINIEQIFVVCCIFSFQFNFNKLLFQGVKSYMQSDLHQGLPICPRLFSFFLSFSMKFNANWTCYLVTLLQKCDQIDFPREIERKQKLVWKLLAVHIQHPKLVTQKMIRADGRANSTGIYTCTK